MNAMLADSAYACLTVLVPAAGEQRLVDWLRTRPGAAVEFSVHAVAAHGPLVRLAPGEESVVGHARRVEVKLIAPRSDINAIASELGPLMAGMSGGYWVLPVERFAAFNAIPEGQA